jgi:hypothetical protein
MTTAKALGLDVPATLLARADLRGGRRSTDGAVSPMTLNLNGRAGRVAS